VKEFVPESCFYEANSHSINVIGIKYIIMKSENTEYSFLYRSRTILKIIKNTDKLTCSWIICKLKRGQIEKIHCVHHKTPLSLAVIQ